MRLDVDCDDDAAILRDRQSHASAAQIVHSASAQGGTCTSQLCVGCTSRVAKELGGRGMGHRTNFPQFCAVKTYVCFAVVVLCC